MVNTKSIIYSFGKFQLNPLARELKCSGELIELTASAFDCLVYLIEHRERPVCRDELISAVWGRVDVSNNLLAQTIVRLRRVLGDANGQDCIKTLARVGYRWMLDTTVVSNLPDQPPVRDKSARAAVGTPTTRAWSLSPWLWRSFWIAPLFVLVAAAAYWRWRADDHKPISFNHGTAIVLPAEVNAPGDWKWLRLGLMDLISDNLREARIPVESSLTVLNLLNQSNMADNAQFASFALVIHTHVTLVDNTWHVHLDAISPNGRTWEAESTSDNVLNATRSANNLLLAQIGEEEPGKRASDDTKEEYLMRMDAASYAGSIDAERKLIDNAPPDLRETPEFGYAKSVFYCSQGEYEPCKQELAELLQRLPADKQPVLRGRVLAQQWYIYFRERKFTEGEAVLSEAIQLLLKQKNTGYLAYAYAERAELEIRDGKFDQAQSDYGLSRVNYALAGDTAAAVGIDASLAILSTQRGQFAQSIPTIERAYEQYQRMGMRYFLPSLLGYLVISQKMLLQHSDELATTDRYWPFEQKHWEFVQEDVARHVLTFKRALALADNGQTVKASDLLQQLLLKIKLDPKGEPGLQGCVEVLLAKLALERGDIQASQSWISEALAGHMLERDYDKRDYADAWLTNVMVMQRAGKPEELRRGVAAMQAWVTKLSVQDEWIAILLIRAQATEAWSEGRHDQALSQLKLAMSKANKLGVPELIVDVGQAYAQALLETSKLDDAIGISGQLSAWSQLDWRAAWTQACVYLALGQSSSNEKYRNKALELAGDRVLPTEASVFIY